MQQRVLNGPSSAAKAVGQCWVEQAELEAGEERSKVCSACRVPARWPVGWGASCKQPLPGARYWAFL